jgi:hypothetical protein
MVNDLESSSVYYSRAKLEKMLAKFNSICPFTDPKGNKYITVR